MNSDAKKVVLFSVLNEDDSEDDIKHTATVPSKMIISIGSLDDDDNSQNMIVPV